MGGKKNCGTTSVSCAAADVVVVRVLVRGEHRLTYGCRDWVDVIGICAPCTMVHNTLRVVRCLALRRVKGRFDEAAAGAGGLHQVSAFLMGSPRDDHRGIHGYP